MTPPTAAVRLLAPSASTATLLSHLRPQRKSVAPLLLSPLFMLRRAYCLLILPLIRCVLKVIMCSESKWSHLVLPCLFLRAEDISLSFERRPNRKKKRKRWHGLRLGSPWKQRASQAGSTAGEIISLLLCAARTAKQTSSLQFLTFRNGT